MTYFIIHPRTDPMHCNDYVSTRCMESKNIINSNQDEPDLVAAALHLLPPFSPVQVLNTNCQVQAYY